MFYCKMGGNIAVNKLSMYLFYTYLYILSLGVVCIVFCLMRINHYRLSLKNIAGWKQMMSQVLLTHWVSQGNLIF